MNTTIRSHAASALTALLLTLFVAGCSKPPSAKTGPLVTAPEHPDASPAVRATLTLGSTQSNYTAHLTNGRVASIDEARTANGNSSQGTYSFYEARLMKYTGDALTSSGHEEIEFDLHGAIKRSQSDAGTPSTDEIGAIRNRAELLRSYALTQQTIQAHQTN